MPRKKKSQPSEEIEAPKDDEARHLYVKGEVPPGHDAPVFDIYFELSEEDFEEKMRSRIDETLRYRHEHPDEN